MQWLRTHWFKIFSCKSILRRHLQNSNLRLAAAAAARGGGGGWIRIWNVVSSSRRQANKSNDAAAMQVNPSYGLAKHHCNNLGDIGLWQLEWWKAVTGWSKVQLATCFSRVLESHAQGQSGYTVLNVSFRERYTKKWPMWRPAPMYA